MTIQDDDLQSYGNTPAPSTVSKKELKQAESIEDNALLAIEGVDILAHLTALAHKPILDLTRPPTTNNPKGQGACTKEAYQEYHRYSRAQQDYITPLSIRPYAYHQRNGRRSITFYQSSNLANTRTSTARDEECQRGGQ